MADEVKSLSASLFETIRPDLASVPLVVSSDVLVMMLRLVDSLRLLLLVPAIDSSPVSQEIKATVQDLENRIAATMKAIDVQATTLRLLRGRRDGGHKTACRPTSTRV